MRFDGRHKIQRLEHKGSKGLEVELMRLTRAIMALVALALLGQAPLVVAKSGVWCDDEKQVRRDKSGPNDELTDQRR